MQESTVITFATLAPFEMLAKSTFGFFQQSPMCVASGSDLPDICDAPCRVGFRAWCGQHAVDSLGSQPVEDIRNLTEALVAAVNDIGKHCDDWFAGSRALVSRLRGSGIHEGHDIVYSLSSPLAVLSSPLAVRLVDDLKPDVA